MDEKKQKIKIHILHCGSISVSPKVPYGNDLTIKNAVGGVFTRAEKRIEMPVSAYLIEHPKGLVLVDTGWNREISPNGEYDAKAAKEYLPSYLAAFYRPRVEKGKTVAEQLAAMGIKPEDLHTVLLTHLDPDHVSGVYSVRNAQRLLMPQEEYWWVGRSVYRMRQPWKPWFGLNYELFWYRGTHQGPLWWSYDMFGDGTIELVCLPGHDDGMCAVKIKNGKKFIILASDAAYTERSWREGIIPGFGFNKKSIKKSLDWLKEQSEDPNCLGIIANHDPDVKPQVIEL